MKKTSLFTLFVLTLILSSSSFAGSYLLKIKNIHCEKCVQKIHDYFEKNLGARVQNLKIDKDADTVSFDSISVDAIEMESIRKGLKMIGYEVVGTEIKNTPTEAKPETESQKL